MGDWFHRTIVESNRLPLFCAFAGVVLGFAFIRLSVRMIRAQVKWWPGNVTPGGTHIHHVVFGVVFMCIGGIGGFALPDRALVPLCITAGLFGIGTALVLDEFALILHLRDVYWTNQGRTSVDAIFVAVALTGLLLVGARPLAIGEDNGPGVGGLIATIIVALFYVGLVMITLFKGKIWTGLIGIFIPLLLLFGAIRVGRPHSPWARWRYVPGKRRGEAKMARAVKRERRYREPLIRAKIWVQDFFAGRPSLPSHADHGGPGDGGPRPEVGNTEDGGSRAEDSVPAGAGRPAEDRNRTVSDRASEGAAPAGGPAKGRTSTDSGHSSAPGTAAGGEPGRATVAAEPVRRPGRPGR